MKTIKDYFKDKIDWKFYNYLLSKLTKYEDAEIDVSIDVCVYSYGMPKFIELISIYEYHNRKNLWRDAIGNVSMGNPDDHKDDYKQNNKIVYIEMVKRWYNSNKLVYVIQVGETTNRANTKYTKEYYETIKNNCNLLTLKSSAALSDNYIIITTK